MCKVSCKSVKWPGRSSKKGVRHFANLPGKKMGVEMGVAYITRTYGYKFFECATKYMWVISQNALSLIIATPSGGNWGRQYILKFFGRCDVSSKFGQDLLGPKLWGKKVQILRKKLYSDVKITITSPHQSLHSVQWGTSSVFRISTQVRKNLILWKITF